MGQVDDRRGAAHRAGVPAPQPARPVPAAGRDRRRAQLRRDLGRDGLGQVLALYDQLLAIAPTPVVALNRAVAVAELDGPGAALPVVDELDLGEYHLFHATRAELLRRLGRLDEASAAY